LAAWADEYHAGERDRANARNRRAESDLARSAATLRAVLLEAMTLTGSGGVIALVLVNGLVLLFRLALQWRGAVPVWAATAGGGGQRERRF